MTPATERALRAACAVARRQGLPADEPRIVRDVTNVLVHLAPAPVVARVPVTLARLRGPAWSRQVVELAAFLAEAGAPVAPPAAIVDPGPHAHDGFHVSFWAHVEHDPARFDPVAAGRSLRALHDALARYPGALEPCERSNEVRRLLDTLEPSAIVSSDELDALRAVRERLAGEAARARRPLHGDSHFNNILWSPDGPLWTDLENACSGPVEWDLACLAWRGAPGTDEALSAYGPYDRAEVERMTPHLALFLAAWTVVVVDRVPTESGIAEARRRIGYALEM
jgi:aminoglycoside phosphotransferase (APT) family kinase protein